MLSWGPDLYCDQRRMYFEKAQDKIDKSSEENQDWKNPVEKSHEKIEKSQWRKARTRLSGGITWIHFPLPKCSAVVILTKLYHSTTGQCWCAQCTEEEGIREGSGTTWLRRLASGTPWVCWTTQNLMNHPPFNSDPAPPPKKLLVFSCHLTAL